MDNNIKQAIDGAARVSVNPLEYPSIKCDCGCETFSQAVVFKKIPGVVLGAGAEEQIVPITVFVCSKCGELMPEYRDKPQSKIIM